MFNNTSRKAIRERFGLTYSQMATITGSSINTINAMENRGRALDKNQDEFYQLYFQYVQKNGEPHIGDLSEMHQLLSENAQKKLIARKRKAVVKLFQYENKVETLQTKYNRALTALKAFSIFEKICKKNQSFILENINLARRLLLRSNKNKLFNSLMMTKIQVEWCRGEIKAVDELISANWKSL